MDPEFDLYPTPGISPPVPVKAYDFIEVFCGQAWVSRVMRGSGRNTAQMDILMSTERQLSSAQNPMDLRTDAGFLHLGWCYEFTRLCLK